MKKIKNFLIVLLCLLPVWLFTQNVAINSTGVAPNASAMLDISSTDKGILIPRVTLTANNSISPITAPADALLIYNTATAGVAPNNVIPGYYYWNTASGKWKWLFSGNLPNIPGNVEYWIRPTGMNYIRPEYNTAIKVHDDGEVHGIEYIGSTNTVAGYFETTSAVNGACAVQGFSNVSGNQTYGYLGFNGSITVGGSTVGGAAVHGLVNDPNRIAVYGKTTLNANIAAIVGYSDCWIPGYFYGDDNDVLDGDVPGIYSQMNVNLNEGGFIHTAIHGNCTYSGGVTPAWYTSATGAKLYATSDEDAIGVYTSASGPGAGSDPNAGYATGYGYSAGAYSQGNGYWAYTAYDGVTNRKIYGIGAVSEIISTKDHGRITLTCPESPEYWYVDYGTVQLVNGKSHVELDPILVDIIFVDADNPLKVILQVNILECNGVAVINKSATGFDLVERNGGINSGEIDYQIIAKPKTNYGEGRFVQAPGPAWLKYNIDAANAKNQPSRRDIFRWAKDWDVYNYNIEDHVRVGEIIPAGPNHGKYKLVNGKYGTKKPIRK